MGAGHTLPVIWPSLASSEDAGGSEYPVYAEFAVLFLANLNSFVLDYLARQKVHGNHLAWYLIEQLPFLGEASYRRSFGPKTAGQIVRDTVLELTYTSNDMAPFARDMGHMEADGTTKPPFVWDEERRLVLRAKLDAVYFHLYGVTDRDDVRYIYSTFPIVERDKVTTYGRYRSQELCLAWMNALAAGDTDAKISV